MHLHLMHTVTWYERWYASCWVWHEQIQNNTQEWLALVYKSFATAFMNVYDYESFQVSSTLLSQHWYYQQIGMKQNISYRFITFQAKCSIPIVDIEFWQCYYVMSVDMRHQMARHAIKQTSIWNSPPPTAKTAPRNFPLFSLPTRANTWDGRTVRKTWQHRSYSRVKHCGVPPTVDKYTKNDMPNIPKVTIPNLMETVRWKQCGQESDTHTCSLQMLCRTIHWCNRLVSTE